MEDIYRKLQKYLDTAPVGYPATKSGVEINLLKQLFTEEEAEIALNLSFLSEPASKIHKRFKKNRITLAELEEKLNVMADKGSILASRKSRKDATIVYKRVPLAFGMFEFQVDRMTKDLAKYFFEYEDEAFAEEFVSTPTKQLRTIPVNVKIDPEFYVGNYDKVTEIIKNSPGPFAVANCVCRQAKDAINEPCQHSDIRETCLTIEHGARHMMKRGVARELSKEEMLKMITRAKKEGFILQPENTQHPMYICCCCGCCCGVLKAAKKFDKPADFIHSNFFAEIDAEKCEACEDCQNVCQIDAINKVNSHMEVNLDRCIGCGLCISVCPNKAVALLKKEKEYVPPKSTQDMYKKIAFEKYDLLDTVKFVGKVALGRKI
jgi:ferredoxin